MKFLILLALVAVASARHTRHSILSNVETINELNAKNYIDELEQEQQIYGSRSNFGSVGGVQDALLAEKIILAEQVAKGSSFGRTPVEAVLAGVHTVSPLQQQQILENIREQEQIATLSQLNAVQNGHDRAVADRILMGRQGGLSSMSPLAKRMMWARQTSTFNPATDVTSAILANQLTTGALNPMNRQFSHNPFLNQLDGSWQQEYHGHTLAGSPIVPEHMLGGLNHPILADILVNQDINTLKKEFIVGFYKNVVETLDIIKTRFGNVLANADTVDEVKSAIMPLKCQKLNGVMNWIMTTNIDITKYNANIFDTYMMCKMVDYATMMKSFVFKMNVKGGVVHRDLQLIRDVYDILGDRSVGLNRYESLMNNIIPTSHFNPIEGLLTGRVVRV